MTNEDSDLVLQLALHKISEAEFLQRYSGDPRREGYIRDLLESAERKRDADQVEDAMILSSRFGFDASCVSVLNRLLLEPWHVKHEDIARALQRLHDPSSVEPLHRAALADFDYLKFDENESLGVKCAWALAKIDTPEAWAKLSHLATSAREPIKKTASQLLEKNRPERPS